MTDSWTVINPLCQVQQCKTKQHLTHVWFIWCVHMSTNSIKQDWLSVLMKITCFMAYAAVASGAKTITVKTTTASSSRAAITPQTHARSHRKASKSICFKNTFLTTLLGGFRDIWCTFSCKEGKIAAAQRTHLSSLMIRWSCHCCCH